MPGKKKLTGYPSIDKPWERGYTFFKRHPIIPNISIYSLLKWLCIGKMDKTAIDCGELTVSYGQMFKDAQTVADALVTFGVKRGDIVAVCMPNFYQAVLPFLACNRIGAIATYLNPGMPDEEIKGYLRQFHSPVLLNYERSPEENAALFADSPTKYIVTLRKERINDLCLTIPHEDVLPLSQVDFHSLGCFAGKRKATRRKLLSGKAPALILYTSGSTGQPKSVVLTNKNVIAALMYANNTSDFQAKKVERLLVCVPFAYPYGLVTSLFSALFAGCVAILAPDIGKDTVSYYYSKNPELVMGSPALLDLSISSIPNGQDLSSVRFFISGGDYLTPNHAEAGKRFFQAHGALVEVGNGSGNAETVSSGTTPLGVASRPETVGIVLVGSSALVIDPESMQEKQYGKEGMLCIAGEHVFQEYYNEPKLTAEAKIQFKGKEYFKTGALGFLDKDGYFTLTGRASRFYIRSSLDKIYLDHVQNLICRFGCVFDCAIVKVPDQDELYVNYAFVVVEKGWPENDDTGTEILTLCRQPVVLADGKKDQLKDFEIPKRVIFLKELPRRSGTDKIDYRALEEMAEEM